MPNGAELICRFSADDLKETWKAMAEKNTIEGKLTSDEVTALKSGDVHHKNFPKASCLKSTLKAGARKGRSGCSRSRVLVKGFRSKNDKVFVYHIACFMLNGKPDQTVPVTCSHLCCDCSCVNPHHLNWETLSVNKTRECCQLFKKLQGYKCPHSPPCAGFENRSCVPIEL